MVNWTSGSKKNLIVHLILLGIFVILCTFTFLGYWYEEGYSFRQINDEDTEIKDGILILNYTSTMVITNYFPYRYNRFEALLLNYSTYSDIGNPNILDKVIENKPSSLADWNVEIHSFNIDAKYGNEQVEGYPKNYGNRLTFPIITVHGMTNTTVTYNWSFSIPEPSDNDFNILTLSYLGMPSSNDFSRYLVRFNSYINLIPWLPPIFPYLIFSISGFIFSVIIFRNNRIDKAYAKLKWFDSKVKGKDTVEIDQEVTTSIKSIISFPKERHSLIRLFFGLSSLMFKLISNSLCKKHNEKIDGYSNIYPYKRKGLKKIFSKVKNQSYDEVQDFFPEFKTITVFLGFLTAVGISFSWDVGAAVPFLKSVFVFYFFMNLGSATHFLGKTRDAVYPIVIFVIAIIAVNFPMIIEELRNIPY